MNKKRALFLVAVLSAMLIISQVPIGYALELTDSFDNEDYVSSYPLELEVDTGTGLVHLKNKTLDERQTPYNSTGLVGHWIFNETAGPLIDYSGQGNDGTAYPLTLGQDHYVPGVLNNSFQMDGINDRFVMTNTTFDNSTEISVEWWQSYTNDTGDYDRFLMKSNNWYAPSVSKGFTIMAFAAGSLSWSRSYIELDVTTQFGGSFTWTDDEWNHYVFTAGDGYIREYKNGVSIINRTAAGDYQFYSGNLNVGYWPLPEELRVDELRFYDRIINATEVSASYNGGSGAEPLNSTGLIGRWKFDESGNDRIAVDSSPTGNNGTLYGTPPEPTTLDRGGGLSLIQENEDYLWFDGTRELVNGSTAGTFEYWLNLTLLGANAGVVVCGRQYFPSLGTGWPNRARVSTDTGHSHFDYGLHILNEYHHYVWAWACSGGYIDLWIYRDGELYQFRDNQRTGSYVVTEADIYVFKNGENPNYNNGTVDELRLYDRNITALEVLENYVRIHPQGILYSTNLMAGIAPAEGTVTSFSYEATINATIDETIELQFSQDNSTWYDNDGTLGAWNTLSNGSQTLDVSDLGFSAPFYYRARFTRSDNLNDTTAELLEIMMVYTVTTEQTALIAGLLIILVILIPAVALIALKMRR